MSNAATATRTVRRFPTYTVQLERLGLDGATWGEVVTAATRAFDQGDIERHDAICRALQAR